MRFVPALLSALLFAPPAAAQDPLQLLKKVAATYAALHETSYEFEFVEQTEYPGPFHNVIERRVRLAGSAGRSRNETVGGVVYVSDGQFAWAYNPDRNEYTKAPDSRGRGTADLTQIELAAHRVKSARRLREETLPLASGPVLCQVIEVEREAEPGGVQSSPRTYWIDAGRNTVLKVTYKVPVHNSGLPPSESVTTMTFSKAAIGQPVDDALFRFTPPEHAVEVDRLIFGPKSPLLGADCPGFELKGVAGEAITPAGLRGSVVLLRFSPGKDEDLVFAEMALKAFGGKGLKVVYVTNERNRPAEPDHAYSVPRATDPGGLAAKTLGIGYSGALLLDRNGKVAWLDTLSTNLSEFARALQKTGIW
jgi:outer membrane lipoprotein-sorting protein